MDDEEILSQLFLPSKGLSIENNKLRQIPRLVRRILAYNMVPKTGSFTYYFHDLSIYVYAIMAKLKVNWIEIIFSTMI